MTKMIRVWFKKEGRARFISHLDVSRSMARALRRAQLPVWYTEGFSPHLFMTYALPLSLGVEGQMESMDIKLLEDLPLEEVLERLNRNLPEGLVATEVTEPVMKPAEIVQAEYEILFDTDRIPTEELKAKIEEFLAREQILVLKHTKRGDREIDIKPSVLNFALEVGEETLNFSLWLPAGESENINPSLLLDKMMEDWTEKPYYLIKRKKILDKEGKIFR